MPAVIEIFNAHNHSTKSADALRQLRVLPQTKNAFDTYFDQGKGTIFINASYEPCHGVVLRSETILLEIQAYQYLRI